MHRRTFVAGAGVAAGLGIAASFPRPAIAQDRIAWKMVTAWPKGLAGLGAAAERLAKRIGELSGGRLAVEVFAAGELTPAFAGFAAVAEGKAEMAHGSAFYHIDKLPAAGFFAAMPFGLTAQEFNGWVNFGGGQELWDELYDPHGVKPFLAGNTGAQMGGWFRKPIAAPADLKGLRICIPGYGATMMAALGALPVTLPASEIFRRMQEGEIDAAEWVGPYNDLSLGLYKLTKFYYAPGVHEPGSSLECLVSKEKYAALPEDLKRVVAAACAVENELTLSEYSGRSPAALATLVAEYKVEIKRLPRSVLLALGTEAAKIVQGLLDTSEPERNDITRRIARSYVKFRRQAMAWSRLAEGGYLTARDLGFDYPG